MKNYSRKLLVASVIIAAIFISCSSEDSIDIETETTETETETDAEVEADTDTDTDTDTETDTDTDTDTSDETLHLAFAAFNTDATDIYLSSTGTTVTIETTGLPNHESVYWGVGNDLYIEESGVALTPTKISDNNNAASMTVDTTPDLTGNTVSTELGTIGIAVSGSAIFNDEEGAGALDQAAASLDWTGAHIGPGVYHYHLEPKAFSDDDDALVGILKDGVFIYGRKCDSTDDYPTDLDASGGHTSTTQYTNGEEEYHYHIINEIYSTTASYIAFAGPFQGY